MQSPAGVRGGASLERVTSFERLSALEPLLTELYWRDPRATPFQSPDWLLPWMRHLAGAASLCWLVACDTGRPVVSIPLVLDERSGERTLRWVGHGTSDRLDATVDPAASEPALELARAALGDIMGQADRVELDELAPGAREREPWRRLPSVSFAPSCICPVLPLAVPVDALAQRLPRWLWRNVTQTQRRLEALGRVEWRAEGQLPRRLEAFFALHGARWQARGEPGVLAEPAVRAFHRAAAPGLEARGLLELTLLYLDGAPLAAAYVLHRTDAHLYLFGFDPGSPRLSLGTLSIWRAIERAARAGRRRFDFLRGTEAYKYAFGAQDEPSLRCLGPGQPSRTEAQAARAEDPGSCPRTSWA